MKLSEPTKQVVAGLKELGDIPSHAVMPTGSEIIASLDRACKRSWEKVQHLLPKRE